MSLGVLNNLNAIYAANNLNNTSSSLSTVLSQLSSGSKINSGADDAAGLSLVDGLEANSTALTQSKTNATEGVGLLTVADGALSQVTSLLNRAVTLATEASNGTLNTSQDTAANQEYQSILSEISNIGSTTTYNGETVFGSTTDIYTGDSTTAGSSINSLNIRSLSSSNVGDSSGTMSYSNGTDNTFLDLSSGGTNASVNDSLGTATASTTIKVSYMTKGSDGSAVQASANITVGSGTSYSNTVSGLISAINGSGLGVTATFGTAADAGTAATNDALAAVTSGSSSTDTGIIISGTNIGVNTSSATDTTDGTGEIGTLAVTDTAGFATAGTDTLTGTLNVVDSSGASHTLTLGTANSTDTLENLATTINSEGWGITATYNSDVSANVADISFTSSSSEASISENSLATAAADATGSAALTAVPTTTGTEQATEVGTLTVGAAAGGKITLGNTTITTVANETAATLTAAINDSKSGYTATVDSTTGAIDVYSANQDAYTNTFTSTDAGITEAQPATTTTSAQYYSIGISVSSTTSAGVTTSAIEDTTTGGGTANTGLIADTNGTGGIATISYSDSAGESLSATDLSTQTDAETALTALNTAISDVAAQDGYIGAQINTLDSVSSVLSTQQENVVSAQNAVQATDYATATSNMSKYEILSQTGIAALAQANSVQQEVTKLLQ
jgi:flagellin